jgi:hypothetical protein
MALIDEKAKRILFKDREKRVSALSKARNTSALVADFV